MPQTNPDRLEDTTPLELGIPGFEYADLHRPARLLELMAVFDDSVKQHDADLFQAFQAYRDCQGEGMSPEAISDLLVRMAPFVGTFVARLFDVSGEREAQMADIREQFATLFSFRSEVVARLKALLRGEDAADYDLPELDAQLEQLKQAFPAAACDNDPERALARVGAALARLAGHYKLVARGKDSDYADADQEQARIRKALEEDADSAACLAEALALENAAEFIEALLKVPARWALAARDRAEWQHRIKDWVLFLAPEKTDFNHLVEHKDIEQEGYSVWMGPDYRRRRRDGFHLTDPRFGERRSLYEVDHCIYCHERDTDSCAKGMRNKKTGKIQINPLGVINTGCPLGEKISEMHLIKREGDNIGALATIIIDNPMVPGTGHRICNECMRACIYQKNEPVNIPQIESNVLTDVLFMPWGFEIYSLLTRWNPLNVRQPVRKPYNGKNALVVGMGPAGYTMSHYLLNEGFGVVGIEALKMEPLPVELTGDREQAPAPIRDFRDIYEDLADRRLAGFGGRVLG